MKPTFGTTAPSAKVSLRRPRGKPDPGQLESTLNVGFPKPEDVVLALTDNEN
jgi:hypothetical protein